MAGLAALAAAVALTALRMPFTLALMLAGAAGLAWTGTLAHARAPLAGLLSNPDLWLVPLVLMTGNIALRAGLAIRLHDAVAIMLQGCRGGPALAAILGSAGLAAASGSSLSCAAAMSRIALPAMRQAGCDPRLAGASVAMGSTLGALLPPSMLLVLWGLLSGTPVGAMFLAGLVPAALSLAGMVATVLWWVRQDPGAAPLPQPVAMPRLGALRAVWTLPVLFAILAGGIASGRLAPVAALAICLGLTAALGLVRHRLTPEALASALRETVRQTAGILLVLVAATLFLAFLDLTGLPAALAERMAVGLPRLAAVALLGLACVALALVAEPLALLVLLMPFATALAAAWGLDAVWAGIVLVKLVGIALVLPPLGLVVIVVATTARTVPAAAILSGVARFLFADLLVLAALAAFPALAGWP